MTPDHWLAAGLGALAATLVCAALWLLDRLRMTKRHFDQEGWD